MGGVCGPPPATSEAVLCHSSWGPCVCFLWIFLRGESLDTFLKKKNKFCIFTVWIPENGGDY